MSFKEEWFIRRGYFLWVVLRLAPGRELLEMSWFSMDLYLSHAQVKCVCIQNSFTKPALVASCFSGDNRKVTMKLNSPTLVDSWALLLNNGEGGRAGSRLEQSNVWALQPGIAPERLRWEKSWCFIVRCVLEFTPSRLDGHWGQVRLWHCSAEPEITQSKPKPALQRCLQSAVA